MVAPAIIAAGIGAGGQLLSGWLNSRSNKKAQRRASQELQNAQQAGIDAYQPFKEQQQRAYNALEPEYLRYLTNPRSVYEEDIAGYEPSGEFNYKRPFLEREAKNAAISGGNLGTSDDERRRAEMINALLNSDMGSYLDRIGNYRGQGLQGFERATARGFEGASALADYLGTNAINKANLGLGAGGQNNQDRTNIIAALTKLAQAGYLGSQKDESPDENKTGGYGSADYARQQRTAQTRLGLPSYGSYGSGSIINGRNAGGYL